jgi:LPXTG-site transpeptidase (sortase) family protein
VAAGTALLLDALAGRASGIAWQEAHAGAFLPFRSSSSSSAPENSRVARADLGSIPARGRDRRPAPRRGEAIARLRIGRLGIDAVVAEGTDRKTLKLGPGHMAGSALPGDPDNCIIAGHRDGPFGGLRSARAGDLVEINDGVQRHRYEIVERRVVGEEDVRDLEPATRPILTLVTCYPIDHLGPAPLRLVVRGELREGAVTAGPPAATARRSCSSR